MYFYFLEVGWLWENYYIFYFLAEIPFPIHCYIFEYSPQQVSLSLDSGRVRLGDFKHFLFPCNDITGTHEHFQQLVL